MYGGEPMSEHETASCGGKASCNDALSRLWDFIDGELTPETMKEIQAHLERCQRCYPHYDFQRAFAAFMRSHCHSPVPAGLRRRIFECLLEEERRVS